MKLTKLKQQLKIITKIVLIILTFTVYSNYAVYRAGQDGVSSIEEAPAADAAIVLGAKVFKSGALSQVLADRMDTGIELYQKGKVKKLLLTGDHGQTSYDEVNAMRRYALERGVPDEDIFMDHAGFSTYDSMYRARDVFMVRKAIIVTQEFHLSRALFIARAVSQSGSRWGIGR